MSIMSDKRTNEQVVLLFVLRESKIAVRNPFSANEYRGQHNLSIALE